MDIFQVIAERKIQEGIRDGLFDNLKGQGAPLVFEDETWIPEDLRIVFRILKNEECIPAEVEVQKEIISLKDLIMSLDDEKERLRKIRQLNFKIMKLDMMRRRPLHLASSPLYEQRLIDRTVTE